MTDQNNQNEHTVTSVDTNMAINEAELMSLNESDIQTYLAVIVKQRNDAHDRESVLKTKLINAQRQQKIFVQALGTATTDLNNKDQVIKDLRDQNDNLQAQLHGFTNPAPTAESAPNTENAIPATTEQPRNESVDPVTVDAINEPTTTTMAS